MCAYCVIRLRFVLHVTLTRNLGLAVQLLLLGTYSQRTSMLEEFQRPPEFSAFERHLAATV
jgi:hypothetical protein